MEEIAKEIKSHPDELFNSPRVIKYYMFIPENGVNQKTGLLGIHTGYNVDPSLLFFKKLRRYLANKYNLITFSVEYLGMKAVKTRRLFVRSFHNSNIRNVKEFIKCNKGKDLSNKLLLIERYDEDVFYNDHDYVDFGFIQALDIAQVIIDILNSYKLDAKRIYLFGSSLGAFVSEMVVKFLPNIVKGVFNISGLLYIEPERILNKGLTKAIIDMDNTLVSMLTHSPYSEEAIEKLSQSLSDMLDIRNLLNKDHWKESECTHVLIGGEEDHLVKKDELIEFFEVVGKKHRAFLKVFKSSEIDGKIIRHAGHSLGGNVAAIFEIFFSQIEPEILKHNSKNLLYGDMMFETTNGYYDLKFENHSLSLRFVKISRN